MRKIRHEKYKVIVLLSIFVLIFGMISCGKKETSVQDDEVVVEESPEPEETEEIEEPEEIIPPEEDLTGKDLCFLTGNNIDEELAKKRPVAVVVNNLQKAMPQSGLIDADLIYEVLTEGDITRLICIFRDSDSKKIGPVRSARDYFLHFARDNNAIFFHHGGSDGAYGGIRNLGVNNIDGMKDGQVFWRDQERKNQRGMYEHSSYTDAEGIKEGIERYGYETMRSDISDMSLEDKIDEEKNIIYNPDGMFNFYFEHTKPVTTNKADIIRLPYSPTQNAYFEYNRTDKKYYRFQYDVPHIDEEADEQLTCENVIIQFANMYVIDNVGRRHVDTVGNGEGYLFTSGAWIPITWEKESYANPTNWYDQKGEKLTINKGKTWICLYDENKEIIMTKAASRR